jgi:hypothetical protein
VIESYIAVESKKGLSAWISLVPTFLGDCNGSDCAISSVNHQTSFFIPAGGYAYVNAVPNTSADLYWTSCTIVGQMVRVQ